MYALIVIVVCVCMKAGVYACSPCERLSHLYAGTHVRLSDCVRLYVRHMHHAHRWR